MSPVFNKFLGRGFVLEKMKESQYNTSGLIKRFLPYYKPYRKTLFLDLFCAAMTTMCELALPLIVRTITNTAINDIKSLTLNLIFGLGGVYLILKIISSLSTYYTASVGHIMGTRMETDMRRDFFSHLQKMPFSYYDDAKVGQLMSRITNDLFEVTEFAHHCPEEFFMAGMKISVSFVILSTMSLPLTLIIFIFLPFMLIVTKVFRKKMNENFRISRYEIGEFNSQIEDSLLGVRVVKSFANETLEEKKFDKGNKTFLRVKKIGYHFMGLFNGAVQAIDGIMYIVVMVAGAIFLMKGKINVGDFSAYLLYVSSLLASIKTIITFTEQFQKGITGIERFLEVMDTEADIVDKKDAQVLSNIEGRITFKKVSFNYGDNNDNVLSNISISIKAGENVAIVGPSGSGKSTLCNLIPRFYEASSGEILIDDTNITDVTLNSLRKNIGMVQQDVYLFSGTVFDNIAYGKLGTTLEEVEKAAVLAGADEFIRNLSDGYNSLVGERGVKLSGGQKQRISIARVFLKNPPILILDEATSALDNESEMLVQKSLEKLTKGRTTLTIAHRLTTIQNADTILVLTENGIEEQGNHGQLVKKGGLYSNLYKMYSK